MSSGNPRTLSERVISCTAALSVAAVSLTNLAGCSSTGLARAYADQASADDVCGTSIVLPYSPYNLNAAREAAGLNDGLRVQQYYPRYNPFVRDVYVGYNYQNKPEKAVYVIPTRNGINNIVIVNNEQTRSGKLGGFFVGAALAGIGGGSLASVFLGIGGGIAAAEAGKELVDDPLNQLQAKRANQCFKKIAEGNYDYTVSKQTGQVVARCREVPTGSVPAGMQGNQWLNYQGDQYIEPCPVGVAGLKGFELR